MRPLLLAPALNYPAELLRQTQAHAPGSRLFCVVPMCYRPAGVPRALQCLARL